MQPVQRPDTLKPVLLTGTDVAQKRKELKNYFLNSWQQYESLFSCINNDSAFYKKAEPLRHPLVFYYGHTAVFYINKLILNHTLNARINPYLESICAVGVDEMSWDDLNERHYDWPSRDEVQQYRDQVCATICDLIDTMDITLPITQSSLAWVILMGIEHERIHLETSSVIIRMLPLEDITPHPSWSHCHSYVSQDDNNPWLAFSGGDVSLGKCQSANTYGWDNEYGSQTYTLPPFELASKLISNRDFLTFVTAGGYDTPEYWCPEGQKWLSQMRPEHPRFWFKHNDTWHQRNLFEQIPLPLDWPVEVNYLEAKAYCQFKSAQTGEYIRLPTEAEWQLARDALEGDFPSWQTPPGNLALSQYCSSTPVDANPHHAPNGTIYDLVGNVWQWTETAINGFDGFAVHPLYDDFSTPTFDGKHTIFKGGSWISTGNEACRDSRYAFRRHFFQHAGFRTVKATSPNLPEPPYRITEQNVDIANLLYGATHDDCLKPRQDTLAMVCALAQQDTFEKALDLGCGVGGLCFGLTRFAKHVDGLDFTANHIQHALALKAGHCVRYALPLEGSITHTFEAKLSPEQLTSAQSLSFYQADAHNLKPQFSGYDLIVCDHLIEHLYDPLSFLNGISERLVHGGVLIISSHYHWQAKTPLSGFKKDGENVYGRDVITSQLAKTLDLIGCSHSLGLKRQQVHWLSRYESKRVDSHFLAFRKNT